MYDLICTGQIIHVQPNDFQTQYLVCSFDKRLNLSTVFFSFFFVVVVVEEEFVQSFLSRYMLWM